MLGKKKPEVVKEVPEIQEEKKAAIASDGGLRCACGEPVAPGQDQVCQKHIRTN